MKFHLQINTRFNKGNKCKKRLFAFLFHDLSERKNNKETSLYVDM